MKMGQTEKIKSVTQRGLALTIALSSTISRVSSQGFIQAPIDAIQVDGVVTAVAWNLRDGECLYATRQKLSFWPSGRAIKLPIATEGQREPSQIRINSGAQAALVFGNYSTALCVVNLASGTAKTILGSFQTAFWAGDKIARIRPRGDRANGQFVQVGTRRRDLPRSMEFSTADSSGTVLLAKSTKGMMGEIALYRFDPKSLAVKKIRQHKGPFYVEYTERDQLDWHGPTGKAAIGLTADTGATFARAYLSSPRGISEYRIAEPTHFLSSGLQFWGERLLVPGTFEIEILEVPDALPRPVFALEDQLETDEQSFIHAAALSPDGKLLAIGLTRYGQHLLLILDVARP